MGEGGGISAVCDGIPLQVDNNSAPDSLLWQKFIWHEPGALSIGGECRLAGNESKRANSARAWSPARICNVLRGYGDGGG